MSAHSTAATTVRDSVPWSRIGGLLAAAVVAALLVLAAGVMLDLATEPLPPCTTDVIQGVCAGDPRS